MRSRFIVGLVMLLSGSIATSPWHRTSSVSATILVEQDNPISVSGPHRLRQVLCLLPRYARAR